MKVKSTVHPPPLPMKVTLQKKMGDHYPSFSSLNNFDLTFSLGTDDLNPAVLKTSCDRICVGGSVYIRHAFQSIDESLSSICVSGSTTY